MSQAVFSRPVIQEKTLFDVLRDVWRARRAMAVLGLLALGVALVFLVVARSHSRAEMVISPANPMGDMLSAPLPTAEGTIAVQGHGGAHDLAFLRFENSFYGMRVASVLMKNPDILKGLEQDRAFVFSAGEMPKDAQVLSAYLKRRVKIEPVSGTPLRRLYYLHPDPVFAAKFLSHIYAVTDELIRAQALKEVQARAAYLDKTIAETEDANHRRVLTDILMAQERIRMLVSIDQPFSAAIVEPPFSWPRPVWPEAKIVVSLFVFLGLLAGFVVHGVRHHA